MKKFFPAIAAIAFVMGLGNDANAAFLSGGIDFGLAALVPDGLGTDLLAVTSFTTNDYSTGSGGTIDFSSTPSGIGVTGSTLDTTNATTLAAWDFSSTIAGTFGTFTADTGSEVSNTYIPAAGNIRIFAFAGTFIPDPAAYPGLTGSPGNATVLLSFTQTGTFAAGGGAGTAISASFTLDVTPVPEPSAIVMLASVFGPAVAFGWMRRKANA